MDDEKTWISCKCAYHFVYLSMDTHNYLHNHLDMMRLQGHNSQETMSFMNINLIQLRREYEVVLWQVNEYSNVRVPL